jgi:hypothetical protein
MRQIATPPFVYHESRISVTRISRCSKSQTQYVVAGKEINCTRGNSGNGLLFSRDQGLVSGSSATRERCWTA